MAAAAVGDGDEDWGKGDDWDGLTVDGMLSGRGPPVLPGCEVTVGFGTEETPYRMG